MTGPEQRIDKWLFFARVVKSRSLAQKLAQSGTLRLNREKVTQSAKTVRPGDVLTIPVAGRVRVLKVLDPGARRGPAPEAATLFEDLSPRDPSPRDPSPRVDPAAGAAPPGGGSAEGEAGEGRSGR